MKPKSSSIRAFFVCVLLVLIGVVRSSGQDKIDVKKWLTVIKSSSKISDKEAAFDQLIAYYTNQNKTDSALTYKLELIALQKKVFEEKKDTAYQHKAGAGLIKISHLYLTMGLPEQANQYAQEARPLVNNVPELVASYYKNVGDAYRMYAQAGVQDMKQALVYYDSLTMYSQNHYAPGWYKRIALDLSFIDCYLAKGDMDQAYYHIQLAKKLAPKWGDETLNSQVNYMAGTIYMERKEYAKALPDLLAAEKYAQDWGPDLYVNLLKSIADAYGGTGQYAKAFPYYQKYVPLRDTIYTRATEKSFADAEAKFQNKTKQTEIELKNTQIGEARMQRIWLASGLFLAVISLVLLGVIYRNKKRSSAIIDEKNQELARAIGELEEANKTKAKLFSIISHDLRSPISQVYQFLKLQQLNPHLLSEPQKAELSQRIQSATGSLLETMEDLLLWSKTQMTEFKPNIQLVKVWEIVDQCIKLLQLNIDSKNLKIISHIDPNSTVEVDPYYLQTIMRNLLQNAIKAANEGSEIELSFQKGQLSIENSGSVFTQQRYQEILSAVDNGHGLNGLGLKLVDELANKSGLSIQFGKGNEGRTKAIIDFA